MIMRMLILMNKKQPLKLKKVLFLLMLMLKVGLKKYEMMLEFKYCKVVNVSNKFIDESKNGTLHFEDIPDNALDKYEAKLKKERI